MGSTKSIYSIFNFVWNA